ncbi:hypothetical protein ABE245_07785 [Brevibacillus porteri]
MRVVNSSSMISPTQAVIVAGKSFRNGCPALPGYWTELTSMSSPMECFHWANKAVLPPA